MRLRTHRRQRPAPQARSSVGERYIDTVEVGSSILPAPTKTKGDPSVGSPFDVACPERRQSAHDTLSSPQGTVPVDDTVYGL